METGDGTLTKHAMTLDVNDVESGGFVIMQRPEIWSRPDANSPYTLESAGVWESQTEVNTPNDFCRDNEDECGDGNLQCNGFCQGRMTCLNFCITFFGQCMHPTYTSDCSCALVIPDGCTGGVLPPAVYQFNTLWNCAVSFVQEEHKICVVAIFAWDTE